MKKTKPPKVDPIATAPAQFDVSQVTVYAVLEKLASSEAPKAAIALFNRMETQISAEDKANLLAHRVRFLRYEIDSPGIYSSRLDSIDPTGLAWVDFLVSKGADPFQGSGSKKNYDYQPGLFETLVNGGYWSYAEHLVDTLPDGAKRAMEAMQQVNKSIFASPNDAKPVLDLQGFMKGGSKGLGLAFKIGISPDQAALSYRQEPWVFQCENADQLSAFIAAGADLSLKTEAGSSLEERFSSRPPSKEKEELLKTLRSVAGRPALDQEAATRALLSIARAGGGWTEFKRAAKANNLDPLEIKTSAGDDMLAVAAQSANWGLASALLEQGMDPAAPCSIPGAPAIGWALLGWPQSITLRSTLSKSAQAKLDAQQGAVFGAIDVAWRGPSGERLLEAMVEGHTLKLSADGLSDLGARVSYAAPSWLEKHEPIDVDQPLWARFIRLKMEPYQVISAAIERPGEPWMDAKEGSLMGWLMTQSAKPGPGVLVRDPFKEFLTSLKVQFRSFHASEISEKLRAAYMKIFAPEQWVGAFDRYWQAERGVDSSVRDELNERMSRALRFWMETSNTLGVEPFEFKSLSKAMVSPWATENGMSYQGPDTVFDWMMELCSKHPDKAGVILLDVLDSQNRKALEVGHRAWTRLAAQGIQLDLPGDHPLLSEPGRVTPELGHHPVWRGIEAVLLTRQTQRPGFKMR